MEFRSDIPGKAVFGPAVQTGTSALPRNGLSPVCVDRARFLEGPFGETLRSTGLRASKCNWKFSTKYTDPESGWVYYGYRYYLPGSGRWPSRDRIAERGGTHLYGFCGNSSIERTDRLGQLWGTPCSVNIFIGHCFDPNASIPQRQLYPSEFYGFFCCMGDSLNGALPIGNSLFPYIPDISGLWPDTINDNEKSATLKLLEQMSTFWCGVLTRLADGCQVIEPAMTASHCQCPRMSLNRTPDRTGVDEHNIAVLKERVSLYRNDPAFAAILSGSTCHMLAIHPTLRKMWNEGFPGGGTASVDCKTIDNEWSEYRGKYP